MVPEGDLVAAQFLCEVEHFLATHPRTEETGLFLLAETGGVYGLLWHSSLLDLETRGPHVEFDAQRIAELLQITGVGLVMDILHPHVQGLYTESWVLDLGALR